MEGEGDQDVQTLDLTHSQITDLSTLEIPSTITHLILRRNRITFLPPTILENTNLKHLDLYDNGLTKIESLPGGLVFLDLSFNRISSSFCLPMTLTELYLCSNAIESIAHLNLGDLKQLRVLELGANKIKTLDVNQLPVSLEELYLGSNDVSTVPDLSPFVNLRILSLQSNELEQVRLCGMNALEQLYLSENKLVNIDELLCECPNLRILDIASNRIECIKIESIHLQELWANDNRIRSFNHLYINAPLTTIYLHGNPLSRQFVNYKDNLKLMLPTLLQIDG